MRDIADRADPARTKRGLIKRIGGEKKKKKDVTAARWKNGRDVSGRALTHAILDKLTFCGTIGSLRVFERRPGCVHVERTTICAFVYAIAGEAL